MREIVLRDYQEPAYETMERLDGRAAGLADMRTGKTVLWLKYLHEHDLNGFVILPNWSINVWIENIRDKGFPLDKWELHVLNTGKGSVAERADAIRRLCTPSGKWIALINNEAAWRPGAIRTAILRAKAGLIGIDEAHSIARHTSEQSKFAGIVAAREIIPARIPLTGTPTSKGLDDYFGIFRFVDKAIFGGGRDTRSDYANFVRRYVVKGGYFGKEIVDYQNTNELRETIREHSFQITRKQAGISDAQNTPIYVKLDKRTRDYYRKLDEDAYARVTGINADGERERRELVAKRAITEILRLQQLTSGIVGTPDAGYIYVGDEKLRAALGIVESGLRQHKQIVIYCRFLPDIWRLCEKLKLKLRETWSGYASESQRVENLKALRSGKRPVLVCQIRAAAYSQDFTAADWAIFYSYGVGLRTFSQVSARTLGAGHEPEHFHIMAEDSIDVDTYANFSKDADMARKVSTLAYTQHLFTKYRDVR